MDINILPAWEQYDAKAPEEKRQVIVAVIDTGIDYTDEVFRDSEGNSRILAIWDQTIQSGTPPRGFYYGTEFTRDEINGALQAEDPYSIVPTTDSCGR